MTMLIARLVEASRRHAVAIVAAAFLLSLIGAACVATYLKIDTDTNNLVSRELPYKKHEAAFDRAFPQTVDLIAIVIDAEAPGIAEDAAATLAAALSKRTDLFRGVRRPDAGDFFRRNGILFLSPTEVQAFADQIVSVQP